MKFIDALRTENTTTENGMVTNSSSLDACVDLFYNIGAMRGQDKTRLISMFSLAFAEDPLRALKILFWARDIRGGAGERQIFRDILEYLAHSHFDVLQKNVALIPEFGRWDDLLVLVDTRLQADAFNLIWDALDAGNGLCAKWMPRQGKIAAKLREHCACSPSAWRKKLVYLTHVVETQMCSNQWNEIQFGKLPSIAAARYQNSFIRNATESYTKYIEDLKANKDKINAGAIFPHDVIKSLNYKQPEISIQQWNALPNYLEGSTDLILPVVDVSGSMNTLITKGNLTALQVAISLGLYIAERNIGPFKDSFITFSQKPTLNYLRGNLINRVMQMTSANWGFNTNLEKTFELILSQAIKFNIDPAEMPKKILILSDMEFDAAINTDQSAHSMISSMYADAGYVMPDIIYWNLMSRNGIIPVSFNTQNAALVSGFSPAILKSILKCKKITPQALMDETILSNRYININT